MNALNTKILQDFIFSDLWLASSQETYQCHVTLEIPNFIDRQIEQSRVYIQVASLADKNNYCLVPTVGALFTKKETD